MVTVMNLVWKVLWVGYDELDILLLVILVGSNFFGNFIACAS